MRTNDMCSIIGYCGPVADLEAVKAGFQRTASRGPDDSWVIQAGGGLLGFHRLAIMGLTPEGIDDPVGAVGVHCANGIWGTVSEGLFNTESGLFYGGGFAHLGIQLLGFASIALYTAVVMTVVFQVYSRALRFAGRKFQQPAVAYK